MKTFRALKILLGLFLVTLGIVIGITIRHYYKIPLAQTINIIDVATLVTTIFLAVYIPEVLDRQLQVKRDKKELITQRIEELQALYRKINLLVQQGDMREEKRLVINNTLDLCSHRFETIITLLGALKAKTSFDKEIRQIKKICGEHRSLLSDNLIGNTEGLRQKEESLYNLIDKETCLLVFNISDA